METDEAVETKMREAIHRRYLAELEEAGRMVTRLDGAKALRLAAD